jgi:molybdopterin-guanine dinucleotide biosynthesis protein A
MTQVGGIVLCGGQSKRMGRPKAWLPFGPEVLLQRVVRILSEIVAPIIVVADEERGRGPLQGLAAGLTALRGQVDAAYLSGCDAPFLQLNLVRRLIALLGTHAICVPRVGEYHHPLAAVYRIEVAEVVQRLLTANRLRPVFLFHEVPTRVVLAEELVDVDPTLQSFRNLNTPEDYQTALADTGFAKP